MAKQPASKKAPASTPPKEHDHSDPLNRPVASEEALVEAAKPAKASKLVRMQRGEKFADVHPAEVDNFKGGGWVEAE